jgi:divalent metal cation (Fe/Co/Zn/Cd) transporter
MRRAVRNLIRFIAAGLVIFGGLEIGLEVMRDRLHKAGINLWHCFVGTILIVAGVLLFAVSARLAEQLTDDIDE